MHNNKVGSRLFSEKASTRPTHGRFATCCSGEKKRAALRPPVGHFDSSGTFTLRVFFDQGRHAEPRRWWLEVVPQLPEAELPAAAAVLRRHGAAELPGVAAVLRRREEAELPGVAAVLRRREEAELPGVAAVLRRHEAAELPGVAAVLRRREEAELPGAVAVLRRREVELRSVGAALPLHEEEPLRAGASPQWPAAGLLSAGPLARVAACRREHVRQAFGHSSAAPPRSTADCARAHRPAVRRCPDAARSVIGRSFAAAHSAKRYCLGAVRARGRAAVPQFGVVLAAAALTASPAGAGQCFAPRLRLVRHAAGSGRGGRLRRAQAAAVALRNAPA
jgi:hypothetical protein